MNPFTWLIMGGVALLALRQTAQAAIDYSGGGNSLWNPGAGAGGDSGGVWGDVWGGDSGAVVDEWGDVVSGSESTAEFVGDYDPTHVGADNLAAFLQVIRYAEGTDNSRGYDTLFGYQFFDSSTARDHPRIIVSSGKYKSDAAGAYQIMSYTWDDTIQPALHLPDFSPASQDAAAVYLLRVRGVYDDIIAGNFARAVKKAAGTWASLPGSPYGQPVRTMPELIAVYESSLGTVA